MKVVIASDSFKGSLDSLGVARAAAEGFLSVMPDAEITALSVADGGEGLTESLMHSLGGVKVGKIVADPLFRPIEAFYGVKDDTAIIEMAAASGLTLLKDDERNPMETTTFGTGELILDALDRGCRKFLVGIGGSATSDGGLGMLSALGWRFLDRSGTLLPGTGASLEAVHSIDDSNVDPRLGACSFTVACDVTNPFCGPSGAAFVFSPQKGATPEMVRDLDRGLAGFAKVIAAKYGIDVSALEGAGAAGGLGGAFSAFLPSTLRSGIEMVLDTIKFDKALEGADLVITGEGKVDRQTPGGKTAAGVLKRALKAGVPCVAIGGMVEMCPELDAAGFAGVFPIVDGPCALEEAMKPETAAANVKRTVAQIALLLKRFKKD